MKFARKIVALAVAGTIGSAALAPATALAQGSCDWYVKISLKQQSENSSKKCGFKGKEWSTKLKVHKDYCYSVPPAVWKAVALKRKIKLATCK